MLSRRDVALGGLLTIGWLAGTCSCANAHKETPRRFGCMLSEGEADALLANSSGSSNLFADGRTPTLVSSGNREFDYALAQTLSQMTDAFGVLPGFAYFDDSAGMNAHATTRQMLARSDGTVLFGRRLLDTLLARREHPDVAVSAVCAHEFGHIAQYKIGIHKQLREGEETARRLELHADFLAGCFAGYRKLQKPGFPAAVYATTQYSAGDYRIDNPKHHGRPAERAAAVVKGFETVFRDRRSMSEAMQIGFKYAKSV
jgi:hypothetical protein